MSGDCCGLSLSQRLSSVLGLQSLDAGVLVEIVISNGFDTVIEGSKVKSLVQLEGELIELEFAGGLGGLGFLGLVLSLSSGLSFGFLLGSHGLVFSHSGSLSFGSDGLILGFLGGLLGLVLGLSSELGLFPDGLHLGLSSSFSSFLIFLIRRRSGAASLAFAFTRSLVLHEVFEALRLKVEALALGELSQLLSFDVLGLEELLEALHDRAASVSAGRATSGRASLTLLLVDVGKLLLNEVFGNLHSGLSGHGRESFTGDVLGFHELLDDSQPRLVKAEVGSSSEVLRSLAFVVLRESLLNEFDGHLETGSLGVRVDFLGVDLVLLAQVLEESNPFLALVARASVSVMSRSHAVVSGESFLHVDVVADHVEGVVLFVVVVSDSVHV